LYFKISEGVAIPDLPSTFSQELNSLMKKMLSYNAEDRPSVDEILQLDIVKTALTDLCENHKFAKKFKKELIKHGDLEFRQEEQNNGALKETYNWNNKPDSYYNHETNFEKQTIKVPYQKVKAKEPLFREKGKLLFKSKTRGEEKTKLSARMKYRSNTPVVKSFEFK